MSDVVEEKQVDRFLDAWFTARQLIQAANFNRFHKEGLSATQFMTLNVLPVAGGSVSMGDLAKRLNLKPATVAQTINSLQERGLVARIRGVRDRRQVLLQITPKGSQFQNAAAGQFKSQMAAIFSLMDPVRRAELVSGLEEFVAVGQSTREADAEPLEAHSSPRSRRP